MARDLDFKPRSVQPKHSRPSSSRQVVRRQAELSQVLIIVLVVLVALVAVYWYYRSSSTSPTQLPDPAPTAPETTQQPTTSNSTTPPAEQSSSTSVFDRQADALVVQAYESGATDEVVNKLKSRLTDTGYTVEVLGKSQYEYAKTYVWYRPSYKTDAEAIGALLIAEGREVAYMESKIEGVFDILVYFGQK